MTYKCEGFPVHCEAKQDSICVTDEMRRLCFYCLGRYAFSKNKGRAARDVAYLVGEAYDRRCLGEVTQAAEENDFVVRLMTDDEQVTRDAEVAEHRYLQARKSA